MTACLHIRAPAGGQKAVTVEPWIVGHERLAESDRDAFGCHVPRPPGEAAINLFPDSGGDCVVVLFAHDSFLVIVTVAEREVPRIRECNSRRDQRQLAMMTQADCDSGESGSMMEPQACYVEPGSVGVFDDP